MFKQSQTRDIVSESDAHASLLRGFHAPVPTTLHQVAEIIRRLFKADAAGIHVCGPQDEPGADTIVGALSMHETSQQPFARGMCKMCLSAGAPIVLSQQEIELTYLRHAMPRIVHVLMAPLYDYSGKPIGATWLAQVTSSTTYSRVDVLMMDRLTHVLAAGLAALSQTAELRTLQAALEFEREVHANALREMTATLEKTVEQSEIKVREAHHRVKNTLQIASSLLSLQARTSLESGARDALREAAARLQVLTHGHEHLYRAALTTHDISVAGLLRFISNLIPPSFAEISSRVRLEVEAIETLMSPSDASSVALIANEVLTNVYKHAFPNDAVGSIAVQLTQESDGATILRIADTGRGMTQPDSQTFGLLLIRKLAQQLCASIDFSPGTDGETGTVFTLRVPARAVIHLLPPDEREEESVFLEESLASAKSMIGRELVRETHDAVVG